MRIVWGLALALLVLAPTLAQTAQEPWTQRGGGPGHAGVVRMAGAPLDVVANHTLVEFPVHVNTEPEFSMAVPTPYGLVMTYHDFGGTGEAERSLPDTWSCGLIRVQDPIGGDFELTEAVPCQGDYGIIGYDPGRDLVLLCTMDRSDQPVFRALEAESLETLWTLTGTELRDDPVGTAASPLGGDQRQFTQCAGGALDPATGEAFVNLWTGAENYLAAGFEGYHVASIDLDGRAVRWSHSTSNTGGDWDAPDGVIPSLGITLVPDGLITRAFKSEGSTQDPGGSVGDGFAWFSRDGALVGGLFADDAFAGDTRGISGDVDHSVLGAAIGDLVAVALDDALVLIRPTVGEAEFVAPLEGAPASTPGDWPGLRAWGATILVPYRESMAAYDPQDLSLRWQWLDSRATSISDTLIAPPSEALALVAQNTSAAGEVSTVHLFRVDLTSGRTIQRVPLPIEAGFLPAAEAIQLVNPILQGERTQTNWWQGELVPLPDGEHLAVISPMGEIVVLGPPDPSLLPTLSVSSAYPSLAEPVTIEVEAGGGGQGADVLVAWGDGTTGALSEGAELIHQYAEAGPHTISVTAVYDDGRTATVERTVEVGGTPPEELNLLQRAFADENQDLTFGVLGVALALAGGAIAVGRQRTRRRRVQRELEAIEAAYRDTRERPIACEAALAERRAHVRGLGLDGKLDQAEVLLLERRVDELAQKLRLESIDEQFGFLTMSMGRTLRDMLADGRISQWEREHFLDALERDEHLTKTQKRQVKEQIEAWFSRDEGVGS